MDRYKLYQNFYFPWKPHFQLEDCMFHHQNMSKCFHLMYNFGCTSSSCLVRHKYLFPCHYRKRVCQYVQYPNEIWILNISSSKRIFDFREWICCLFVLLWYRSISWSILIAPSEVFISFRIRKKSDIFLLNID